MEGKEDKEQRAEGPPSTSRKKGEDKELKLIDQLIMLHGITGDSEDMNERAAYLARAIRSKVHKATAGEGLLKHSLFAGDRGICENCWERFKTHNQFRVPKSRLIIIPFFTDITKKRSSHTKAFWYNYSIEGGPIFKAREVITGRKNNPLRAFFIKEALKMSPQEAEDQGVRTPLTDMYISYKFGSHDFSMYKWFDRDGIPETEALIRAHCNMEGSGVSFIYKGETYLYYQDLFDRLVSTLGKPPGPGRPRKQRGPYGPRKRKPADMPISMPKLSYRRIESNLATLAANAPNLSVMGAASSGSSEAKLASIPGIPSPDVLPTPISPLFMDRPAKINGNFFLAEVAVQCSKCGNWRQFITSEAISTCDMPGKAQRWCCEMNPSVDSSSCGTPMKVGQAIMVQTPNGPWNYALLGMSSFDRGHYEKYFAIEGWTLEQTLVVLSYVLRYGTENWSYISNIVHHTPEECRARFWHIQNLSKIFVQNYINTARETIPTLQNVKLAAQCEARMDLSLKATQQLMMQQRLREEMAKKKKE
eukprot:jgi/Bigna1/71394/fgenesh1_pg.15_\